MPSARPATAVLGALAAAMLEPIPAAAAEPAPRAGDVGAAVLPAGRATVAVVHELQLSTFTRMPDELGTAWATGVDGALAVTPRLTVGLAHSARAQGTVDRGGGWCHDVGTHRCVGAYAGGLLDARWRVRDAGGGTVVALGRLGAIAVAPLQPVVRLGGAVRAARDHGRLWLVAQPEVQIALGHRALGNRDVLIAPLWLGLERRRGAAWLATGLRGQFVDFGAKWEVPLVLGAALHLGRLRVGGEVGFPRLLGPQNTGNVRHGAAWLAVDL